MVPICVETLGAWGPAGHKFMKELGRKISEKTHEKRSTSYIMQNISMEIQRSVIFGSRIKTEYILRAK